MAKSFLLKEEFPQFTSELKQLLEKHTDLQKQVDNLKAVDRCRCGESSCSMIYTMPPPKDAWGKGLENYMLDTKKGMIILDVLNGKIASIEILDRDEIHSKLNQLMPQTTNNQQLTTDN